MVKKFSQSDGHGMPPNKKLKESPINLEEQSINEKIGNSIPADTNNQYQRKRHSVEDNTSDEKNIEKPLEKLLKKINSIWNRIIYPFKKHKKDFNSTEVNQNQDLISIKEKNEIANLEKTCLLEDILHEILFSDKNEAETKEFPVSKVESKGKTSLEAQSDGHGMSPNKKLKENNLENSIILEEQSINENETETKEFPVSKVESKGKTSLEDKVILEAFASQLVSGYFNENRDISTNIKNYLRINIAFAKMEHKLRSFFVRYMKTTLKEEWLELSNISQRWKKKYPIMFNNAKKFNFDKFTTNCKLFIERMIGSDDNLEQLLKVFTSSFNEDSNELKDLHIGGELAFQNMNNLYLMINKNIKGLDNDQLEIFHQLMHYTNRMRNKTYHHTMIHQQLFDSMRNGFLEALKSFDKKFKDFEENSLLNELYNSLSTVSADFDNIFNNENPQKEFSEATGIHFKLPCDYRKRGKTRCIQETTKDSDERSLVEILNEVLNSDSSNEAKIKKLFDKRPKLREIFYEAYKEQDVDENQKKPEENVNEKA